jgi:hypothetical protein
MRAKQWLTCVSIVALGALLVSEPPALEGKS